MLWYQPTWYMFISGDVLKLTGGWMAYTTHTHEHGHGDQAAARGYSLTSLVGINDYLGDRLKVNERSKALNQSLAAVRTATADLRMFVEGTSADGVSPNPCVFKVTVIVCCHACVCVCREREREMASHSQCTRAALFCIVVSCSCSSCMQASA
jgi:hypothetical protein